MTSPKQSPLGVNAIGSLINNTGFQINPVAASYMGVSKVNATYTPGTVVNNTCLRLLTYAINNAYTGGQVATTPAGSSVYDDLISIGSNVCPALGNSKPPTYVASDPSGLWTDYGTPATSGYANDVNPDYPNNDEGQGQEASWLPYNTTNPNLSVTQWGFLRNYALQAWNEYNWNGIPSSSTVQYKNFASSFMNAQGFIESSNPFINIAGRSITFLKGTYSNMNDLTSGDITGVNLATATFGRDCITLGKVIDLSKLGKFGLPSTLLQSIYKYNALTQSLTLSLLSAGMTPDEVSGIASGEITSVTKQQEQQIYGSFLVIVGIDLTDILVPLNCKTKGLTTLADLLDVKKMFPNSYASMTVPMYNTTPNPTNSKTYYPIYEQGGVSSRLNNPNLTKQVGTNTPFGTPPIRNNTTTNIQILPVGFNSYLQEAVPDDIGTASGAFAFSMLQIPNIRNISFEKFAQVTASIEVSNVGLNLVNGTDVPANTALAQQTYDIVALGSGPEGTYTMSDFFGCMSGLPYSWNELQKNILAVQTTKLANIYNQLYLAASWEGATISVQYSETVDPLYTITGITLTDPGGGYYRGTASTPPTITFDGGSGATATCTIGTDPTNVSTYGRVTSVTLTSAGSATATIPTATVQCPPTATLPVTAGGSIATGGTNTAGGTAGWPGMNTVVSAYIAQANAEITSINTTKSTDINKLNTVYNVFGKQLLVEQRARYHGISPVSEIRDTWLSVSPTTEVTFIDLMTNFMTNTYPHMYGQTLEAITNLSTVGGQSIIALGRQIRNQIKLEQLGITSDTSIPDQPNPAVAPVLLSNGTTPTSKAGVPVNGINGDSTAPTTTFTLPSLMLQIDNETGNLTSPIPQGYFDPNTNQFMKTGGGADGAGTGGGSGSGGGVTDESGGGSNGVVGGSGYSNGVTAINEVPAIGTLVQASTSDLNNINLLGPNNNGTGPALFGSPAVTPNSLQTGTNGTGTNGTGTNGTGLDEGPNGTVPALFDSSAVDFNSLQTGTTENFSPDNKFSNNLQPIGIFKTGARISTGDASPIDTGAAEFPGSLAGSQESNLLPATLNTAYTSSVLLPSILSVQDAIDEVVKCNCDCWID